MKLVIKDSKPKETEEETVEIWLEQESDGGVVVKSKRRGDAHFWFEAVFGPDGTACSCPFSNFEWK